VICDLRWRKPQQTELGRGRAYAPRHMRAYHATPLQLLVVSLRQLEHERVSLRN